ncbi:DUF4224 domain-containing protein [Aquisalimonas lutea]|uniref:DUF4224 domain-containing protein n=1 Tax=Aquisalimonas lutea TaxID=1327750 RepID=UPI0025B30E1A|nr:DUF4224 domain-containing protein [Aquisalimonas lutea]MDN3519787.1 DUF4224 domain-containing protein [Aquisalimonas lutea]
MTQSLFLTHEEIVEMTGKQRKPAQLRCLRAMKIEHRVRIDGSPAVTRSHVEATFAPKQGTRNKPRTHEPDWSSL